MTGVSPLYLATEFGGGEARGEREREREREERTGQASRRRGGVASQRASESSGAQQGCGVDCG